MLGSHGCKAEMVKKWVLTLAPLLFFGVNENRAWLLVNFVIMCLLMWSGVEWKKTLFYMFLLNLPFESGLRGWQFQVVAGYSFFFGLTVKYVWWFLILITYFKPIFIKRKIGKMDYLGVIFLVWILLGTWVRGTFLTIEWLGLIKVAYIVGIYFIGSFFWRDSEVRLDFKYILIGWLLFFGLVGVGQWLKGGTLGLFLEETNFAAPFGFWTNESHFLMRISGTMGHPTFFSSWLSMILVLGIGVFWQTLGKKRLLLLGIFLSTLALVATYGRSGWVAMVVGVVGMRWIWGGKINKNILRGNKYLWWVFLLVILCGGGYFVARLASFSQFFEFGGSGVGRIELVVEWWNMMKDNWWWGVGLNRFTEIMYQQKITDAYKYFLYPVHNTWLMVAVETGVVGVLTLVLWVAASIKRIPKKIGAGMWWMVVIVFVINSQFHALFYQDPTIDLLMLSLGYLRARQS